ncbi:MAG: tetratricopeptide repeat protein [Candidatus Odinarchaeota archaeon]
MALDKFKIEFKVIEKLISEGNYKKALQIIESTEKKKYIPTGDTITLNILKSSILNKLGEFGDAVKLVEHAIEMLDLKDSLKHLDTLVLLVEAHLGLGDYENASETLIQCEKILQTLSFDQREEFSKRKANLICFRGLISLYRGDLNRALVYLERSLHLYEKISDNRGVIKSLGSIGGIYRRKGDFNKGVETLKRCLDLARIENDKKGFVTALNNLGILFAVKGHYNQALNSFSECLDVARELGNEQENAAILTNIAGVYLHQGDLDQALEYQKQSLALKKKIGNKRFVALSLYDIGSIYSKKGNLNEALHYLTDSLDLFKEIGCNDDIAMNLNNLSVIYLQVGNLDQALEYQEQSFRLKEKIGSKYGIAISFLNFSKIYQERKEFDKALEYCKHGLVLNKEIGNALHISRNLFQLISVITEYPTDGDEHKISRKMLIREATNYLDDLAKMDQLEENKIINQHYRLGKALVLALDEESRELEAQSLFHQVAREEIVSFELTVFAMLSLSRSLFKQYMHTGNQEKLKEMKEMVNQVLKLVEKEKMHGLIMQILFLQGKIKVLEFNLPDARTCFHRVLTRAREGPYEDMRYQCEDELAKLQEYAKIDLVLEKQKEEQDRNQPHEVDQEILEYLKGIAIHVQTHIDT